MRVLVDNSRPDIQTTDVLERLTDALDLIAQYQPIRFRHLQRDVEWIWIVRYPCRGAYSPAHRACITELTFLARRDISAAVVASSILHESVHARADRFRVHVGAPHREEDLPREERLCRNAELTFGRALPVELGAPVVQRALETLSLGDADVAPTIDWNVARARINAVDKEELR
jgi:hypothetical protein